MHIQAKKFIEYCMANYSHFIRGKVLDVGSGDINGNLRSLFASCFYMGCDVLPGKNVDIVSPCHELPFADGTFDVIVSSECFEHDMHYTQSFQKIAKMLKPGGIFIFTCASTGRPEHGTMRCKVNDSFTTKLDDTLWNNYYKNLDKPHILEIPEFMNVFGFTDFYYNRITRDLYFVGIKNDTKLELGNIPKYSDAGVVSR